MKSKNFSSFLKQIITIQEVIINNSGEEFEQWQNFLTIRAEVRYLYETSLNNNFSSMQIIHDSYYRFRIRFIKEINMNMRIIYDERYFMIEKIINQEEKNSILIIIAKEII
jgi:SPP1 family predicted phage head-tail adaptor